MIYLIDPTAASKDVCLRLCGTYCGIKPCYGVPPEEI